MKPKKLKKKYMVLCHRNDLGDEEAFVLQNAEMCDSIKTARRLMREDFNDMRDDFLPDIGKDDMSVAEKGKDEITLSIPILNGETMKEDWLICRWKIVEV